MQYERLALPIEHRRALLVKRTIHRRARQKRAAWEALESALAILEEAGADLWAEKARAELGRVGTRRSAPDELTETERRVTELAASCPANKQIAAQAFLTPKSVEDVLARIYRKRDIHSRAGLGARMTDRVRDERTTTGKSLFHRTRRRSSIEAC